MEDELESSFIRVSSTDENSSIGIYLFVFMIILGVFCIGSRMDTTDGFTPMRRDLTQMFKAEDGKVAEITLPVEYEANQKSTYSTTQYIELNPKI
jgi:hypothetical protein